MNALSVIEKPAPIFLASHPVDMRLGLPGLQRLVTSEAHKDPFKLGLYIFVSKDKHRVKIFWYDNNGFAFLYKFIPKGTFKVEHSPGTSYKRITAVNLKELLHGVPKRVRA